MHESFIYQKYTLNTHYSNMHVYITIYIYMLHFIACYIKCITIISFVCVSMSCHQHALVNIMFPTWNITKGNWPMAMI